MMLSVKKKNPKKITFQLKIRKLGNPLPTEEKRIEHLRKMQNTHKGIVKVKSQEHQN